ncbi:hypothetical protein Rleg2_1147 [Rhizobium leguminosarum bv. trifolii WSM2304]|uniref:DUF4043 family protein n=1 Tax=Rhizobium leguminosarum bv. trifolii (strain WSM2304) TaxID=395492 RepID=A0ABF7QKE6_RHILW|nr:DUF4043 family protein [Rhizobium leguminosarum]ACI54441.1 hypothetical protein Rleg2_1147 [Rhizobium leguminosarum bv. trifolii WSM2304]
MTTFTENIATGSVIKPVNVADAVFRGYKEDNRFKRLMGNTDNSVIFTKAFDKVSGDSFKFPFSAGVPSSAWVSGNTRLDDATVQLTKTTDTVTIDLQRVGVDIKGVSMSQQRATFDLLESDKLEMKRAVGEKMESIILTALLDTSAGRVSQRYRYGSDEANYNATAATAKANVDATDDKLKLTDIAALALKAKRQAVSGGLKMNPYKVESSNGTSARKWIYLAHPLAIRDLKASSGFMDLIKYKDRPEFDLIGGSDYIGEYEGVLIYEFNNDSMLEATAGASSSQIAHNLLLGVNACGVGFGKVELAPGNRALKMAAPENRGIITIEDTDHGQIVQAGFSMVTGAKQLCENTSGTSQAFGTIHHYVSAVE